MHKFQANDFIKLTLLIKAYQSVNHKCWCIIVAFWHPTFLFVPFNYCSLSHCGWKSRHGHWDGCLKYKKIGTVNLTSEMVQQLFNNYIEWKYCGFQIIAAFNMNYNWQSIMRLFLNELNQRHRLVYTSLIKVVWDTSLLWLIIYRIN